jgi:hypothetical protein
MKLGKALTWDQLADLYPGKARIRPMDEVFEWFEKQTDKYKVDEEEGTIHQIISKN